MFKLKFVTANAAFENDPELEIARILRHAADVAEGTIGAASRSASIYDVNGNKVGEWSWKP